MSNETARERVAEAIDGTDYPLASDRNEWIKAEADAAIAAYNAWLWEQAERPEVVEAGAKCLYRKKWGLLTDAEFDALHLEEQRRLISDAAEVVFGAITALLGPRKDATNAN